MAALERAKVQVQVQVQLTLRRVLVPELATRRRLEQATRRPVQVQVQLTLRRVLGQLVQATRRQELELVQETRKLAQLAQEPPPKDKLGPLLSKEQVLLQGKA